MDTMMEALKKAGMQVEEVEEKEQTYCLPFIIPSDDEEYDEISSIKKNIFSVLKEEIENYDCNTGKNIKKMLLRNLEKIKVFEGENLNFNTLYFYFEYQPKTKRFLAHSKTYGIDEICENNNIPYKYFSHLQEEELAFYLAKHCEDIILYINTSDTIMSFRDISYTFEEILNDKYATYCLSKYLSKIAYVPNPKKRYFIEMDWDILGNPKYYLKKE